MDTQNALNISHKAILDVAKNSRDFNPLHVNPKFARKTYFGGQIVHGILAVIKTLALDPLGANFCINSLDIEFRKPVFPDADYAVYIAKTDE